MFTTTQTPPKQHNYRSALQRIVDEATRELKNLAGHYERNPNARHEYRSGRQQVAENIAYYALGMAERAGVELDTERLFAAEDRLAAAQLGVTYES